MMSLASVLVLGAASAANATLILTVQEDGVSGFDFSTSGVNLTTAGPADWVYMGDSQQKASTAIIAFNGGSQFNSDSSFPNFSWTSDGSPTASGTNVKGVRHSYNPSLVVTIPAGYASGTLKYWTGRGHTVTGIWSFDLVGDGNAATTFDPSIDRTLFTVNFSGVNPLGDTLNVTLVGGNNGNGAAFATTLSLVEVPEPASLSLLAFGMMAALAIFRKQR